MSQLDRHLTTEQLSALLDDRQEGDDYRAHLASCQQCQQELAELGRTVHLLRALPPPALPRSFVLPPGITQITPDGPQDQAETNIHVLRSTNSQQRRIRARPTAWRSAASVAGMLAAVVGILFVLSGFVSSTPMLSESTAGSSSMASSASVGKQADTGAASTVNGPGEPAAAAGIRPQASTPTAAQSQGVQANQVPDPTQAQNVEGVQAAQQQGAEQAPPTTSPALDWGGTGVRIGLGILLFIAGMMGIAVGRERSKGAKR